ncbi:MAG: hypothetical protein ACK4MI_05175 [Brevundimonas sp.]|jgi:hypothetical protein|uniref:hypothetical protein n=1 Tax=Brevundimonas sp. TaxID=1871086 RepID=UPI0025DBFF39|nr:hypothetical protein [uncultured Brevundimonas sp.]
MILPLIALLMSFAVIAPAEDWDLVALTPDWVYAVDGDSIVGQGSSRTFDAIKMKSDGVYQKINLTADCSRFTIRITSDGPASGDQMLGGDDGMRTPLAPEIAALGRVCSNSVAPTNPRWTIDFPTFLRKAQELMEEAAANQARRAP